MVKFLRHSKHLQLAFHRICGRMTLRGLLACGVASARLTPCDMLCEPSILLYEHVEGTREGLWSSLWGVPSTCNLLFTPFVV